MTMENKPDLELETLSACPLCGSAQYEPYAVARDLVHQSTTTIFEYCHCEGCGVVFQRTRPTERSISIFYPDTYAPYGAKARQTFLTKVLNKLLIPLVERYTGYRKTMRTLERYRLKGLTSRSTVLDFGCGTAATLDACKRAARCKTIGMDFNPRVLASLAKSGHQALLSDKSGWECLADQSVDLIISNHSIEHLYDPIDALKQLRRVLKPGGTLDLATPNPKGFSARLFNEYWFGLEAPRHIMLFSPELMTTLLKKSGFTDVEVFGEPVIKDYLRSHALHEFKGLSRFSSESHALRAAGMAYFTREMSALGLFDRYHLIAR